MTTSQFFNNQLVIQSGQTPVYANGNVVQSAIDQLWGGMVTQGVNNFSSYFDYFFSGQDIVAMIGLTDDNPNMMLPICGVGFNVTQNKMPLYGFWSYKFDAVLRGTRLVQGTFSIATRYPGFLRDVLSHIAYVRYEQNATKNPHVPQGQSNDQVLVQQFWGDTLDPSVRAGNVNIFSVHPPFDFVIIYGVQNISLNNVLATWGQQQWVNQYQNNNAFSTDTNERLVADSDLSGNKNRITFTNCEITGVELVYAPDGNVLCERYSFFAQDIVIP